MHRDDETRVAHAATFPRVTRIRSPFGSRETQALQRSSQSAKPRYSFFSRRSSFRPVAVNLFSLRFNFLSSFSPPPPETLWYASYLIVWRVLRHMGVMATERINMILLHTWPFRLAFWSVCHLQACKMKSVHVAYTVYLAPAPTRVVY